MGGAGRADKSAESHIHGPWTMSQWGQEPWVQWGAGCVGGGGGGVGGGGGLGGVGVGGVEPWGQEPWVHDKHGRRGRVRAGWGWGLGVGVEQGPRSHGPTRSMPRRVGLGKGGSMRRGQEPWVHDKRGRRGRVRGGGGWG